VESSLLFGPTNISDPSLGCPIIVAAGRVRNPRDVDETPYFVSGSGTTFEEAAERCVDEADETYLAQVIPRTRILRSRAEANLGRFVDPSAILLSGEGEVDGQMVLPQHAGPRWAQSQQQKSAPIDWILSDHSLGTAVAWVPAQLCFLAYPAEYGYTSMPPADSNGLALGTDLEDTARRSLFELIERDATAIWWYNQLILPRIDPATLGNVTVSVYEDWLRHHGRILRLLRLTMDLPVPVVAAISSDSLGRRPAMGFAADFSTPEAARRAVSELAQCEANLALLEGHARRQGIEGLTRRAAQLYRWHHQTDLNLLPHLEGVEGDTSPAAEKPLEYSTYLDILRQKSLDVFAVILAQDKQRCLVRIVVPGLRSTKPRFGAGRLYSVPGDLGLRPGSSNPIYRDAFPF
jgi:thiazole/oxazole-forming peptide maturase SagD family component